MRRAGNFLAGFIIGGLISAVLGLIFAPSSGPQLRQRIVDYVQQTRADVEKAAKDRRTELEIELQELRKPEPKA
ncbi:MAG TPA: YtxH domain-containing protein [Anaerolineaceae bacterium]|nr:YtxH domain-containing protein [Anaerolineaceae bacterium]HNS37090.1 YtxH domain-containing protein [Anaerolineaceae bacterium]HNZ13499.1 YtxH domain-containing protein [Anaerolineaceae bacterium]HOD05041.1 YtxH domain-containing protein [Anaerolineaceae bacterium]HQF60994.1 YtxH domain-containing protein [Anaerolineaceae bacterium]